MLSASAQDDANPRETVPRRGRLEILAQDTFDLSGDTARLITFLNQTLKDRGLIFGLSRTSDQRFLLTVYRTS